jgi:hypothetical protein
LHRIGFAGCSIKSKLFEVFMKSGVLFRFCRQAEKLSLWLALCAAATAASAAPSVHPEVKACKSNLEACEESLREAPIEKLQILCEHLLPSACSRLIDRYHNESRDTAAGDPPAVCREGEPTWDEAACQAAALQMLTQTLAGGANSAFPAARLDALPAMCRKHSNGELCVKVADQLWEGGRYLEAARMLKRACTLKDTSACDSSKALAGLSDKVVSAPAREGMPCGHYASATGLMREFNFVDRGKVEASYNARMSARLEDGLIRIRHDKGGDFVLRYLADGRLLGLDDWNRYALYKRDGGMDKCAAPVVYREVELKQDCRAGEDMSACCQRGGLQGCNAQGHTAALADKWDDALKYYERLCRADVRTGCENVVQTYAQGGVDRAKEVLNSICAKDAKAVACDVADNTNWAELAEMRAIQEALKEMDEK